MSVGRKRLDIRDPKHRRWCFQCMTIAALCVWVKFRMLFSKNYWKSSVKIPIAEQYRFAVMGTEDMWSESLLMHLVLKIVFVSAERWVSDRYAGSILIFCKAFTIQRFIHDGNPGWQRYIPRSRIRAGNDGVRIPQYWIDIWSRDRNGYRDVSVPAGSCIVNMFLNSQNLYMKWRILSGLFFCLTKYPRCHVCKLFWKTEIFIRSRATPFPKAISFKCFCGGLLKGPVVNEISVPNHEKNPLG
jgi:hypothetical protein